MADYYPVMLRAIGELDPQAHAEIRRALYERARVALLAELHSVQPSLPEGDIENERLALEHAIRWAERAATNQQKESQLQSAGRIDIETLAELTRIIAQTDPFGSSEHRCSPPPPCERYEALPEPDYDLPAGPPSWLQRARAQMKNHSTESAEPVRETEPSPRYED